MNRLFALALCLLSATLPAAELVLQSGHLTLIREQAAFHPNGHLLATADNSGVLYFWDLSTRKLLRTVSLRPMLPGGFAFAPDGATLVVSAGDVRNTSALIFIDVATGKELRRFPGRGMGSTVAMSPDGGLVFVTKELRAWAFDARTGNVVYEKGVSTGSGYARVVTSKAGLVAFSGDIAVYYDAGKKQEAGPLPGGKAYIGQMALSNGGRLFARSDDRTVYLHEVKSGNMLAGFSPAFGDGESKVKALAFSADEKVLLAAVSAQLGGEPGLDIVRHDVVKGTQHRVSLTQAIRQRGKCLQNVTLSPDGASVLTELCNRDVALWDTASGAELAYFRGLLSGPVRSVRFSPNSRLLAAAGASDARKGFLHVWDLETARIVHTVDALPLSVLRAEFRPDGREIFFLLESADTMTSELWAYDLATRQHRKACEKRPARDLRISTDGKLVLLYHTNINDGSWSQVQLVDAGTCAVVAGFASEAEFRAAPSAARFPARFSRGVARAQTPDGTGGIVAEMPFYQDTRLVLRSGDQTSSRGLGRYWVGELAATVDGKRFFVGGFDGSVTLLDASSGRTLGEFRDHRDTAPTVDASPDGRFVATGGGEGSVVLRRPGTGEAIATLLATDPGESIAYTPDGYYLATRNALRNVAFRVGTRAYPFEQFDLRFNQPHRVLDAIGYAGAALRSAYERAYQKRVKRMGFDEAQLTGELALPELTIDRERLPKLTRERTLSVTVKASDLQETLDRLLVTVNGVPFDGRLAGVSLRDEKQRVAQRTLAIPLSRGVNKIQVSVLNARGVESLRETVEVTQQSPTRAPNLYLLAVGVSEYAASENNLRFAAKDARDLAQAFQRAASFGQKRVVTLVDGDATRETIAAKGAFLREAGVDDLVVIFFAGHGLRDSALDYYFATHDLDFTQPAGRGLPYEAIEGLLDGVAARRRLLLVDTCNSGEIDKDEAQLASVPGKVTARGFAGRGLQRVTTPLGGAGIGALLSELFADLRRGSGTIVIAASGGAEYALESESWNNGVFTFALLNGMASKKADANRDGKVFASELRNYVSREVRQMTQGQQTPSVRGDSVDNDFALD